MHPRNRHQGLYDFDLLKKAVPELSQFIVHRFGKDSIEFMDPAAVKTLNRALLKAHYNVNFWDIPDDFLTPPIPGRADYVHTISDLVGGKRDSSIRVLDIGTGANLIYPLIGHAEYDWKFVGSDVNKKAVENARVIVQKNNFSDSIEIRLQSGKGIFQGIIGDKEKFDLTMCNPPFHASLEEAAAGTERKWRNLKRGKPGTHRNFGGQGSELWCEGGEKEFVTGMIKESKTFGAQVRIFTTLVSKDANLIPLEKVLKTLSPMDVRVLEMTHGQKKSRVLAWSFQSKLA